MKVTLLVVRLRIGQRQKGRQFNKVKGFMQGNL